MPVSTTRGLFPKLAAGLALGLASFAATAQTTYTVIFAEGTAPPTNPTFSTPHQINDDGVITIGRRFTWLPPSEPALIGLRDESGEAEFWAFAINDFGVQAGNFITNSGGDGQIVVNNNGALTTIGTGFGRRGDRGRATVADINNRGDLVGGRDRGQGSRAFIFRDGRFRNIGTLGGDTARVSAINERRQVVGQSRDSRGRPRAFLWQNGRIRNLGTLTGRGGFVRSRANDINDAGVIVGWSERRNAEARAFVWRDGRMESLGALDGTRSEAHAINNDGVIVGDFRSTVPAGFRSRERHAAVWTDGVGTDLNAPGVVTNLPDDVTLSTAVDINDQGMIIGYTCSRECAPGRSPFTVPFVLIPNE